MLLDTVAQCAMMLSKACKVLFARIPHADPCSQACEACKTIAYKAICKVLYATTPQATESQAVKAAWAEMNTIKAPKAWMFGQEILGVFLMNISGVDDRRWAGWWAANGLGRSGYGWTEFSRLLLSKHSANVIETMRRKATPPPALAPASTAQIEQLAAALTTRVVEAPKPVLVTAEEHMPDVGDLQPDVEPAPTVPAVTPAESFEPPPQAPSADETRATSGPASQPRRTKVAAGDGQPVTRKARAHVRVSKRVLAEAAKAEEDLQQKG